MTKFLFFYSKSDGENCGKAVAIMTQFNMNHLFTPISVDKDRSGKRPTLVSQLRVRTIPAIHANNQLFEGNDCFKFLKQLASNPQECTTTQNDPLPNKAPSFALARKPILPPNFNPGMVNDQPQKTTTNDSEDYDAILSQYGGPPKRSETDVFGMPAKAPEKDSNSNRLKSVWG